jgi:hypothetical protein
VCLDLDEHVTKAIDGFRVAVPVQRDSGMHREAPRTIRAGSVNPPWLRLCCGFQVTPMGEPGEPVAPTIGSGEKM